ncbi:hypothetical protein RJT34_12920 [Clitoria ternatea]|uniref:DUF8003 domain-containing protein n=1 Tax=Clitoria ternatea TaxID=43366 RepID=A0AAN9JPZ8_CLITE
MQTISSTRMKEYPVGTYKNVSGSDRALCHDYPPQGLPYRALYIPVRAYCGSPPSLEFNYGDLSPGFSTYCLLALT